MATRQMQTPIMHRIVGYENLIFLGGVTCDDESLDMAGQTREILSKIESYLEAAGSNRSRLLSATIYITDFSRKPEMDVVWKEWLEPEDFPARTTVGVADLGGTALVEITVTAYR